MELVDRASLAGRAGPARTTAVGRRDAAELVAGALGDDVRRGVGHAAGTAGGGGGHRPVPGTV